MNLEQLEDQILDVRKKADRAAADILILYRKVQDLTDDLRILNKEKQQK